MIQIHPVKLESYLFSEKQCWPAGGGFSKTISLCIPQMCPWFHSKVRGYQRRNKGGTKINRYFYFVHILSIPGYATFIIIQKSSRWAVFFGKSLFSGQFSREKNRFFFQGIQLFSCKKYIHNFASGPALSRDHTEHLTFSEKTHLRTPFFPEQLSVAAFNGSSQLRNSGGKGVLKNNCSESFQVKFAVKILEKQL